MHFGALHYVAWLLCKLISCQGKCSHWTVHYCFCQSIARQRHQWLALRTRQIRLHECIRSGLTDSSPTYVCLADGQAHLFLGSLLPAPTFHMPRSLRSPMGRGRHTSLIFAGRLDCQWHGSDSYSSSMRSTVAPIRILFAELASDYGGFPSRIASTRTEKETQDNSSLKSRPLHLIASALGLTDSSLIHHCRVDIIVREAFGPKQRACQIWGCGGGDSAHCNRMWFLVEHEQV